MVQRRPMAGCGVTLAFTDEASCVFRDTGGRSMNANARSVAFRALESSERRSDSRSARVRLRSWEGRATASIAAMISTMSRASSYRTNGAYSHRGVAFATISADLNGTHHPANQLR